MPGFQWMELHACVLRGPLSFSQYCICRSSSVFIAVVCHLVAALCKPHCIHAPSCQRTLGLVLVLWQPAWVSSQLWTLTSGWYLLAKALLATRSELLHGNHCWFLHSSSRALARLCCPAQLSVLVFWVPVTDLWPRSQGYLAGLAPQPLTQILLHFLILACLCSLLSSSLG